MKMCRYLGKEEILQVGDLFKTRKYRKWDTVDGLAGTTVSYLGPEYIAKRLVTNPKLILDFNLQEIL